MIIVCWVDDCLFFGPHKKEIDKTIKDIEKLNFTLIEEDTSKDVFTFLGVELVKQDGKIVLSQGGLIKKMLKTTGMEDCNRVFTPATQDNLGADTDEESF